MNTYTHLSLDDSTEELIRMEELENAKKELEKNKEEKPVSQKMFWAIYEEFIRSALCRGGILYNLWI